jgi:hypothetical protein
MATADYEGSAGHNFMRRANSGRFNLVARFPDPPTAERAVVRLKDRGFDANDVSLLGSEGDFVQTGIGLPHQDAKVVWSSFRDAVIWGAVGAIACAIVGVIIYAIPGFRSTLGTKGDAIGYIVAALIGAIIGVTLGGLSGGIAGLDRSRAGRDTYADQIATGIMLVGVHAEGDRLRTASSELRSLGALDVRPATDHQVAV